MKTVRGIHWVIAVLALVLSVFLWGCEDNETPMNLGATLTGAQLQPPVETGATGTATIDFADDMQSLTVRVNTQGEFTSPVTQVQIRAGQCGTEGPVLFTLYDVATAEGAFASPLTVTLNRENFEPQPPGSPVANYSSAVSAITNGNAYVNIETQNNPEGEICGQIKPLDL